MLVGVLRGRSDYDVIVRRSLTRPLVIIGIGSPGMMGMRNKITIFSKLDRTDVGPASHTEGRFHFLDRSARPEAERVREQLDRWLDTYPRLHREELAGRIRSPIDAQFYSAVFELYLFQLFVRLGYRTIVHPDTASKSEKVPDFLLISSDGHELLVEAVLATEESDSDRAENARLNEVYATLDKVESPDFFAMVDIDGSPQAPLPGNHWRSTVQEWVSSVVYEDVLHLATSNTSRSMELLPSLKLHDGEFSLTFTLIPKKPEARGKQNHRFLGGFSPPARWVQSWKAIQKSVRKKASRYGQIDQPFVIAVNALGEDVDDEQRNSLYGRDGIWRSEDTTAHTRVSAVILAQHLMPWTVGSTILKVCHNPGAAHICRGPICTLPQRRIVGSEVVDDPGVEPWNVLGLPARWPFDLHRSIED